MFSSSTPNNNSISHSKTISPIIEPQKTTSTTSQDPKLKEHGKSNEKRLSTPLPIGYKTPIKASHFQQSYRSDESDSQTKPEQTEAKAKKEGRQFHVEKVETEERKYSKITGSANLCDNDLSRKSLSENNIKSAQALTKTVSQHKRPSPNASNEEQIICQGLTQRIPEPETKNLKRGLFTETPLYVSNKRLKRKTSFYKGSIKLFDKLQGAYVNFRVFKESELGFHKVIQEKLRNTKIDDDCPTDSEQMELATQHVQKQLRQGIDMQKSSSPSPHFSSSSSSYSKDIQYSYSETFSSFGASSTSDLMSGKTISNHSLCLDSSKDKRIAKKLSYGNLENIDPMASQDFKSPERKPRSYIEKS